MTTTETWREIFRGEGGGPRDAKPSLCVVLLLAGLPVIGVRPSVGVEPLNVEIQVRATQESRTLYVAVSDSLGPIVSSSRDVTPGQGSYTFKFRDLGACECEVSAYSIEPNEIRLLASRSLLVMSRSR